MDIYEKYKDAIVVINSEYKTKVCVENNDRQNCQMSNNSAYYIASGFIFAYRNKVANNDVGSRRSQFNRF